MDKGTYVLAFAAREVKVPHVIRPPMASEDLEMPNMVAGCALARAKGGRQAKCWGLGCPWRAFRTSFLVQQYYVAHLAQMVGQRDRERPLLQSLCFFVGLEEYNRPPASTGRGEFNIQPCIIGGQWTGTGLFGLGCPTIGLGLPHLTILQYDGKFLQQLGTTEHIIALQ